tara:strand:- start:221 stop:2446 length:2226 start_codon:yes stop_codon:yes gene_type:complete
MSELQDLIQKAKDLENAQINTATSADDAAPLNARAFIEKAKNLELQKKGFNPDGTIGEVPSEFVFDPERNQYVDTALIAKRELESGSGRGSTLQVLRGVPFLREFVDEIQGETTKALGLGETQAKIDTQVVRELDKQFREKNPKTALGLNIAGGVTSSLPLLRLTGLPSLAVGSSPFLRRTLLTSGGAGILGGIEGAISGIGMGETPEERADKARTEGILGGLLSTGLGLVAPAVGSTVKNVYSFGKDKLQGAKELTNKTVASALGISQDAARILRDAISGDDVGSITRNLKAAGDDSMLAQGSQSLSSLLDVASQSSGAAKSVASKNITESTNMMINKLSDTFDNILGSPVAKDQLIKNLKKGSASKTDELYRNAYTTPIDYSGDQGQKLLRLLKAVPDGAVKDANSLLKVDSALGNINPKQIKVTVGKNGELSFSELPSTTQLDYITRGLNNFADEGKGAFGGMSAKGSKFVALSKEIRNVLKDLNPNYRQAVDNAADNISRAKGIDFGYGMLSKSVKRNDVIEFTKNSSAPEIASVKQGVRSYIDDVVSDVNRIASDPDQDSREIRKLLTILTSNASRAKMVTLLGARDGTNLMKQLGEATRLLNLKANVSDNSKTFARTLVSDTIKDLSDVSPLKALRQGEIPSAVKKMVQVISGATEQKQSQEAKNILKDITRVLTERSSSARTNLPATSDEVLDILARVNRNEPVTQDEAERLAKTVLGIVAPTVFTVQTQQRAQ